MSSGFRKGDHVHVSGVGGVGMNAVAQLLLAAGCRVTGSDRFLDQGTRLPVLDILERAGVELVPQDGTALSAETRALVISTAVEADNPERMAAVSLGIREWHRAEVLAALAGPGPVVAIAGTSGKTTCTGWLAWVLTACGKDPNMVNGAAVPAWRDERHPGNVRLSQPDHPWVIEVDESDRSLIRFTPEVALINTITEDHHSMAETVDLFRSFANQVTGTLVCGMGVHDLLEGVNPQLVEIGKDVEVSLPGAHNRRNAAAVLQLAIACGCDPAAALDAIRTFPGVERRLERKTVLGSGPQVFDDYAHNPEKIAAALEAVQPEGGRLIALWRPHGFASLQHNFEAFVDAFCGGLRPQDEAWILPVFYAGGTAPTEGKGHQELVEAIQSRGAKAIALKNYPAAVDMVSEDVLLVMGARDPDLSVFAERIASSLS